MPSTTRPSASSQVAGRSGPPFRSRTSGMVSRSGARSGSAAVNPLRHMPPRLVGKSRAAAASSDGSASSGTSSIAHCMAQYGQCDPGTSGGLPSPGTAVRAIRVASIRSSWSITPRAQPIGPAPRRERAARTLRAERRHAAHDAAVATGVYFPSGKDLRQAAPGRPASKPQATDVSPLPQGWQHDDPRTFAWPASAAVGGTCAVMAL